jgi:UDP-N-acetyl-D-glucosamine dehydrogenase
MSPERIDPGRTDHTLRTTPKVVGGLTPECTRRATELYAKAIDTLVPVSSPDAAEMAKLLENIFRSVNIALVNELAMLCDRMGLDVWEVIHAAGTKPYGFMRFTPGPGLGGHCIPIDPFYLSWRARQFDFQTEFIELAGKVNTHMPYFCAERVTRALNDVQKPVSGSRVRVLGVSYKADVGDTRESPAVKLIELLHGLGADLAYHDPHVQILDAGALELRSVELDDDALSAADLVCVVTPHSAVDYGRVAELSQLVLDFRNVVPRANGKVEAL